MASSGTYSYTVNQSTIVRQAMLDIGQLDGVEQATPEEYNDVVVKLNLMVKQWQGKADFAPGLKTFTRRHGHLFLSATTGRYTLGPAGIGWTQTYTQTQLGANVNVGDTVIPVTSVAGITVGDNFGFQNGLGALYWTTVTAINTIANTVTVPAVAAGNAATSNGYVFDYTTAATQPVVIESVFLRDITNTDTPLNILQQQEFDFLPSKTNPTFIADPTAIYYESLLTNSYLYTDCAGSNDTSKHICITYLEAVQDITNPSDTTVYPQEWLLPLCLGLGKQICPMFHAEWTPLMQENYVEALAIARRKEPEVSRMYYQSGSDE